MIDVPQALQAVPEFSRFVSVANMLATVSVLARESDRFTVRVVGTTRGGTPVHHIRFGRGRTKALLVGFPHPNEPIGGLTICALLQMMANGHPSVVNSDVEWHILPCIDPDGARLNEGWTLHAFDIDRYVRESHRPELRHQVDATFPIEYKRLRFTTPSREALMLKDVIDRVRPDFYYSLHNTHIGGGVWFALTRALPQECYAGLYELLRAHGLPLRRARPVGEWSTKFSEGVYENYNTRKVYDQFETSSATPERLLDHGDCSWTYLDLLKPSAVTFVAELIYLKHPLDGSEKITDVNCRQFRLSMDADNKYITTTLLEEWDRVADQLDQSSPFYLKVRTGIVDVRQDLYEGLPSWPWKTRDLLCNPAYSRPMTKGEIFSAYLSRCARLCQSYEFVRLLKASPPTDEIRAAIERLERVFDDALAEVKRHLDPDAFEPIELRTLARVQLGAGLLVLNSVLASRAA